MSFEFQEFFFNPITLIFYIIAFCWYLPRTYNKVIYEKFKDVNLISVGGNIIGCLLLIGAFFIYALFAYDNTFFKFLAVFVVIFGVILSSSKILLSKIPLIYKVIGTIIVALSMGISVFLILLVLFGNNGIKTDSQKGKKIDSLERGVGLLGVLFILSRVLPDLNEDDLLEIDHDIESGKILTIQKQRKIICAIGVIVIGIYIFSFLNNYGYLDKNSSSNQTYALNQINNIKIVKEYSAETLVDNIDTIQFGTFPQNDKAGLKKEPIEWIVLENNTVEEKVLLLSKNILEYGQYSLKNNYGSSWKTSEMRRWLNDEFYKSAFSDEEKTRIIDYRIKYNNDSVIDHVFILNRDEYDDYFTKQTTSSYKWIRAASPTKYALRNKKNLDIIVHDGIFDENNKELRKNKGKSEYALRGELYENYAYVDYTSGYDTFYSRKESIKNFGIRPAIWISYNDINNTESANFKKEEFSLIKCKNGRNIDSEELKNVKIFINSLYNILDNKDNYDDLEKAGADVYSIDKSIKHISPNFLKATEVYLELTKEYSYFKNNYSDSFDKVDYLSYCLFKLLDSYYDINWDNEHKDKIDKLNLKGNENFYDQKFYDSMWGKINSYKIGKNLIASVDGESKTQQRDYNKQYYQYLSYKIVDVECDDEGYVDLLTNVTYEVTSIFGDYEIEKVLFAPSLVFIGSDNFFRFYAANPIGNLEPKEYKVGERVSINYYINFPSNEDLDIGCFTMDQDSFVDIN